MYTPGVNYIVDHSFSSRNGQDIQVCHIGREGGHGYATYEQDVKTHVDGVTSDVIIDQAAPWHNADGSAAPKAAASMCDALITDTLVGRVQVTADGQGRSLGPVPVTLSWVPIEGLTD